jgi:hypothetical protein
LRRGVATGDFPFEDHEHLLIGGTADEEGGAATETSEGEQGDDKTPADEG